jgi:hypothetical protein
VNAEISVLLSNDIMRMRARVVRAVKVRRRVMLDKVLQNPAALRRGLQEKCGVSEYCQVFRFAKTPND